MKRNASFSIIKLYESLIAVISCMYGKHKKLFHKLARQSYFSLSRKWERPSFANIMED